jgi:hypothetical protein
MANKNFDTLSSIYKYLESEVIINTSKIAKEIADVLKNYVRLNWYNDHSPSQYQRTMDILNSISITDVKKNRNGYSVKIFFDDSKINMIEYDGLFNAHMGIYGETSYQGMSLPQWVVYWMNYGQNSPIYSYEGVGFLEDVIEWNKDDKYHINRMQELLENKGFDISVI